MGTKLVGDQIVGDHMSRGTKFDGDVCPGGPNWLETICSWGPNFLGPFVHGERIGWGQFVQRDQLIGDQLWGTKCPGTICVRDQMCHSHFSGSDQNRCGTS